ncbi:MAG: hypothetical protein WD180_06595, partial [Pseudohongiellaceae bacterium]
MSKNPFTTLARLLLLVSPIAGCTTADYRDSADTETYAAIADKAELVPGVSPGVSIDQIEGVSLEGVPVNAEVF